MSRMTSQDGVSAPIEPVPFLGKTSDVSYIRSRPFQSSKHTAHRRFRIFRVYLPWNMLTALFCLLLPLGCSDSSEWDAQWHEIIEAIDAENFQEAKTRLTGLLPMVQQEGPRNPHYAQVIFHLGTIAQREGRDKQAEAYFWEALPLWAQSVGPEHPQMAVTLSALAALFEKQGKTDTALPLLKRAVAIEEKAWGRSDPRRLSSLIAYHHLLLTVNHAREAQEIQVDIAHLQGSHSPGNE